MTSARRLRDDLEAESRKPDRLRAFTKQARAEIGAAGDHLIASKAEKLREEWVSSELVDGRHGTRALARVARRLSVHEGARRAGPRRAVGRPGANHARAALDHRVCAGGAPARLDPRLPHGRADHRVLRPRPAPRVPRRARGHRRRDPRRPRGGRHPGGGGPGPGDRGGRRCTTSPRASGTPCATGTSSSCRRTSSAAIPSTTTGASPSTCPSGRSPAAGGCSGSSSGPTPAMTLVERVITALPIRGKQAQLAARMEDRHALAKRALGYVELYGAYTETDARYRVDNLIELWAAGDDDDHGRFEFDPGVIDWDHYVHEIHLPSVLEHTRVRTKPGQVGGGQAAGPAAPRHPVAGPAPRRLRPRAHADVLQRRRHLCLAGQPPPVAVDDGRASSRTWSGRLRRCWRWTGATAATSCAPSTGASRTRRSIGCGRTRGSSSTASCSPGRSPTGSPGCGRTGPPGHRTLLITGALDFIIEPIRPLFDDIVCADMESRDGRLTGHLTTLPPDRRGAGSGAGRLRGPSTASRSRSPWPTPTRPATWPCSKPSASRWRSTPSPGCSAIARRRGWHVEHWAKAEGGSHRPLPLGPFDVESSPRRSWAGEHAPLRAVAAPLRRGTCRVVLRLGTWRRGGPAAPRRARRSRRRRRPVGCTSTRCCRGSAGRTWPRWTDAARAISRTSSPSPSCPATRSSGTLDRRRHRRRGRRCCPPAAGWCSSRCSAAPPGVSSRRAPPCQAGQVGELRVCRLRAHPSRPADGLLRRHRWRLVELGARRALQPALRGARRAERCGRGDGRARGLRGARRARSSDRRRRCRWRSSARARSACS